MARRIRRIVQCGTALIIVMLLIFLNGTHTIVILNPFFHRNSSLATITEGNDSHEDPAQNFSQAFQITGGNSLPTNIPLPEKNPLPENIPLPTEIPVEKAISDIDIEVIFKEADATYYRNEKLRDFQYECSLQSFRAAGNTSQLPDLKSDIFFIETACHKYLLAHQSCAIESACQHNPEATVALKTLSDNIKSSDPFLMLLKKLPNFRLQFLNPWKRVENTDLEKWFRDGVWDKRLSSPSIRPMQSSDLSNAFRYLELYLEGGLYMDLDIITLRSLAEVRKKNIVAKQHTKNPVKKINGAFFSITSKNFSFVRQALSTYTNPNWKGNGDGHWGINGPELITRMLKESGCESLFKNGGYCEKADLTILPQKMIYPVMENVIYEPRHLREGIEETKSSYTLHLWNSKKRDLRWRKGDKSLLDKAAKENCPFTYKLASRYGRFY